MASTVNLKALGLNTQPNQLEVPNGSLSVAKNVVIRRDGVIESRRGFKLFGALFGSASDRAKQLLVYKNRILRHYNNILSFQDGVTNDEVVRFTDFSGSYTETEEGLRIKYIESNKNLYFTTSEGIKKIAAKTADDLSSNSGFITNAGGVKALDLTTELSITDGDVSGFLPVDSTVAYRVVWGLRDINDNLILGTPSERSEIYSPILNFIIRDYTRLLGALDDVNVTGSLINDGDYISDLGVTINASAETVRTNAIALAAKLDNDILYADTSSAPLSIVATSADIDTGICYVGFNRGSEPVINYLSPNSLIMLDGFSPAVGILDEGQTVLSVSHKGPLTFAPADVNIGTDTITIVGHTFINGDAISFTSSGTLPGGISAGVIYWVIGVSGDTFKLTTVRSSVPDTVDISSTGSGTHTAEVNFISFAPQDPTASGVVTLTSPTINSNEYRSIDEPIILTTIPTHSQLNSLHEYISDIMIQLQAELQGVIPTVEKSQYIDELDITTTSNVLVSVTIPQEITTDHFMQVYRSATIEATGTDVLNDLTPSDEMQLVYEVYPTQSQIDDGLLEFIDITPDEFRGANLYTNAATGEGILQSNDIPPFAKDINLFRGYVFYANTQTRHRKFLNLLGITRFKSGGITSITATNPAVITSNNHGLVDGDLIKILSTNSDEVNGFHEVSNVTDNTFEINVDGTGAGNLGYWTNAVLLSTNDNFTNEYSFVLGDFETCELECVDVTSTPSSGYFLLYSASNKNTYSFWYDKTGSDVDPAIADTISVKIDISTLTTDVEVAEKTRDIINRYSYDFSAINTNEVVTILNAEQGPANDIELGPGMSSAGYVVSVITQGRGEKLEKTKTEITTVADIANSLAGTALIINTPFKRSSYYFWFRVSGNGVDPNIPGRIGIVVDISTNATADDVAEALTNVINTISYFTATRISDVITVTNTGFGESDNAGDYNLSPAGFSYNIIQKGALEVLLSSSVSPSLASEETSKSLVRSINKNDSESIYAYYLSGSNDVSGQMLIESRELIVNSNPFYLMVNNDEVGGSFNPDLSPEFDITSISAASQSVITVSNHGLRNGDKVVILGSNSFPSIDGIWEISNATTNTFTIPTEVSVAGDSGVLSSSTYAENSENETKPNRIYYSKFQQPEAVPIINFIDVGPEDQAILRIVPLRSSLFIFKEDGLYRLSGENAPFNVEAFDNSLKLLAPDSIGIIDNVIYCWADTGITQVSEGGTMDISRPIDNIILKISSNNFPNFRVNTFGIGYDSDRTYTVWTIQKASDVYSTIAYTYNTITRTWTTYDKTNTCVLLNPADDVLYLGAGDINSLEQERKTFSRLDYADREVISNLDPGRYFENGTQIRLANANQYKIGDVVTQEQQLTTYIFNSLLKQLDNDSGPTDNDYFSTLQASGGDDLRSKIMSLAQKLDLDTTVNFNDYETTIESKNGTVSNATGHTIANPTIITSNNHGLLTGRVINILGSTSTPTLDGNHVVTVIDANTFSIPINVNALGASGNFTWVTQVSDFQDVVTCYNEIVTKLNIDTGVNFSSYAPVSSTSLMEAVVTGIDSVTNTVFLSTGLQFVIGPLVIYKSIPCEFQYTPNIMEDPLGLKHLREATMMFENKAFTRATLSFASDLFPAFIDIEFPGDGSGLFGNNQFGEGFFGGGSHSAPFRTYIPKNCQRCRFIIVKFKHSTAREIFSIFGVTITGEVGISSRAYRR